MPSGQSKLDVLFSAHGKVQDTGGDSEGTEGDSLESAIRHLARDARTTGDEPFKLRRSAAIAQRKSLVEWAESRGLTLSPSLWRNRTVIGGSEHDIWEEPGEVWKVTRPDKFGWTVLPRANGFPEMSDATPLEYLERWSNSIRFLGDFVKLRGVAKTRQGVQVVISQRFIKGPYPSQAQIARDLKSRGFTRVPEFSIGAERDSSFYHQREKIAIFDAAVDNFILSQGVPVPVDVIPMRVGEMLHAQLMTLIEGG